MSPASASRFHISATAALWRGSVVRMKSSFEIPTRFQVALNFSAMLVAVRLRLHALLARDALDLLAVLVEAGQEEDVLLAVARARW